MRLKLLLELRQMEEARARAQDDLEAAEASLAVKYEDVGCKYGTAFKCSHLAQPHNSLVAALQASFTPPSTPTRSQKVATPIRNSAPLRMPVEPATTPTGTPSRIESAQATDNRTLPITPGGRVILPEPKSSPTKVTTKVKTEPSNSVYQPAEAYYVVYHGRGGEQGIYDSWDDTSDGPGARGIVQFYKHRLFKKFANRAEAQMFYDEVEQSGVLDLLQAEPTLTEMFIVTKGVQPGVYSNR